MWDRIVARLSRLAGPVMSASRRVEEYVEDMVSGAAARPRAIPVRISRRHEDDNRIWMP